MSKRVEAAKLFTQAMHDRISTLEPIRNGIFMELATLFLHGSPSPPYESLRKSNAAISYFLAQKCQKEWKPQQAIH